MNLEAQVYSNKPG